MLHGRETGAKKDPELRRLRRNQHAMTLWTCAEIETKHPQLRHYRNLAWGTLHWFSAVGDSDGMTLYNGQRNVSNLCHTFNFLALERNEDLGRHGLDAWRPLPICVLELALTHWTDMHGELLFGMVCCCQPHRMGHTLIQNGSGWMDGWMLINKMRHGLVFSICSPFVWVPGHLMSLCCQHG